LLLGNGALTPRGLKRFFLPYWFLIDLRVLILIMGGEFSIMDYFIWNEIPTVLGNLVGGLAFTGLTLYSTHIRTAPNRSIK